MQRLIDSNPSEIWLAHEWETSLVAADGALIVVRYSYNSRDVNLTAEDVITRWGDHILADRDTNYGEYLNVAATIAGVLNERIRAKCELIHEQVRMVDEMLGCLSAGDYGGAEKAGVEFISLLDANWTTNSGRVWGIWLYHFRFWLGWLKNGWDKAGVPENG